MTELGWVDYLFLLCLVHTWLVLLFHVVLTLNGYRFHTNLNRKKSEILTELTDFPMVSILIPAHNEEKVIARTVLGMLALDYPAEKLEIIMINDNSSDRTGEILEKIKETSQGGKLKIITTDKTNGGKGKSNALNLGLKESSGEYIVVYDADNTPEKFALRYLVTAIHSSPKLGAVIGKFRTRNKNRNLLSRFINIETISFQWIAQAGRWQIFGLCTIPGTNFIIRRSILEDLGGWDTNAIAEDTELSFRIYKKGFRISFMPLAVTWEQEPEKLGVWMKQRTRWVKGNIYVLLKYFKDMFYDIPGSFVIDLYYYFVMYFLFSSTVLISDFIFVAGLFTEIKISLSGNYFLVWLLAYVLFILELSIALTLEKGESNFKNFLLVAAMYFTYSQLWLVVVVRGMVSFLSDRFFGRGYKWYKTERF